MEDVGDSLRVGNPETVYLSGTYDLSVTKIGEE